MEAQFLSIADVMALHVAMMEDMGHHPAPLRDPGLLESAVLRPQMAAHYEDADLVRQASVLTIGISQNQPYVDGNKRTAYISLVVFLRLNGQPFAGDRMDLARELERVAERSESLADATYRFEEWLRERVVAVTS